MVQIRLALYRCLASPVRRDDERRADPASATWGAHLCASWIEAAARGTAGHYPRGPVSSSDAPAAARTRHVSAAYPRNQRMHPG